MQKKQTIAEADVEKEKLNVDMYSLNSRVNDLYFGILLLDEQFCHGYEYRHDDGKGFVGVYQVAQPEGVAVTDFDEGEGEGSS